MRKLRRNKPHLGMIAITVVMLVALGSTIAISRRSANHWRNTVRWDQALAGASEEVAGIEGERSAQALYAATANPRFRQAFEQARAREERGRRALARIVAGEGSLSVFVQAADRRYAADVVERELFPAVARHDSVATRAALLAAEQRAEVGYQAVLSVEARIGIERMAHIRIAEASARDATTVAFTALALALLAGIVGTLAVVKLQRRRERDREREQLLTETQLHNEELLRIDHEKDNFIACVSHELRTPLTSIRGYTELLADDPTNLTKKQRNFLAVVDDNAMRLLKMINDLLVVAEIGQMGVLAIRRTAVDLRALVTEAVESGYPAASLKDIELRLTADEPVVVEGDQTRIAQVVENLLSNALKFTRDGGRVGVHLSCNAGTARLEIADTGPGMTPEEQSRLFMRFYRTESATRAAIQGPGLGLAISQAIAQAHGGAITVTSEPDTGSTFTLVLPVVAPAALPAPVFATSSR